MINQEIQQHTDNIAVFLEKRQLKNTFDTLAILTEVLGDWNLKEQLEQLQTTYKYMLQYMISGAEDPERKKVYNDLLRSSFELADQVIVSVREKSDTRLYFQSRRNQAFSYLPELKDLCSSIEKTASNISLNNLLDDSYMSDSRSMQEKELEELSAKLFRKIWLSNELAGEESTILKNFLQNKQIPFQVQCIAVSALTLGLKDFFDKEKLSLLFDAYEQEGDETGQRALVGILLILFQYDKRMFLYPGIQKRLLHHAESKQFIQNINTIIRHFIQSRETEKISKRITEELMPEMMKISPNLSQKINLSELLDDTGMEEKNPEWKEILDESGLTDKLQEITELQMEGADVMHSSFSNLKMYPFFHEISNWFLPFVATHSSLDGKEEQSMHDTLQMLAELGYMCNSDKYSLYFTLLQMPASYRKMMSSQMFSEAAEMMKQEREDQLVPKDKQRENISKQYIQDLYRFYKVYPKKADFEDIFATPLSFHQTKSIGQIIAGKENLLSIGEYYFSKNQWKDAGDIFGQLVSSGEVNAILFQKIGYCEQMNGHINQALDAYLKSELVDPENSWTLKKIASCYRLSKNPEKALLYYQKVEKINPDNLSVQLNIGHCHLELKKYQEALKSYFKVEYLNSTGTKSWRPIAWCSFLTGKFEQSIQYYEKILSNKPEMTDYMNYGHALLAVKQAKKAIEMYKSAVQAPESSREKFIEAFMADAPELILAGIAEDDIPVLLDEVMYSL